MGEYYELVTRFSLKAFRTIGCSRLGVCQNVGES